MLSSAQACVYGEDNFVYLSGTSSVTENAGPNTFVFSQGIGGQDTIGGFTPSTDSMQFSALDFANYWALSGQMSQSGANTVITLNASDTVTLTNVQAANLTSANFHFV